MMTTKVCGFPFPCADEQGWGAAQYSVLGMTIGATSVSPGTKSLLQVQKSYFSSGLRATVLFSVLQWPTAAGASLRAAGPAG